MTSTTSSSPVMALNDDSLLELFFRFRAEYHPSLTLTCKRFRDMVLSSKFRRERALAEWAEVSTRIWTPEEMFNCDIQDDESTASSSSFFREYYNDLGYIAYPGVTQAQVDFMVDGKKAGEATYCLVNRRNTRRFHEACDAISGDLQETGCCFFDTKGRPRIASVRDAIDGDKNALLYIKKIKWNPEYRRCSFVGAQALRSFLKDPKLQDKWAVAIYIPEAKEQYTEEDESTASVMDYRHSAFAGPAKSQEDYAELEAWERRCEELTNIDMRECLRAGFRQVQETVQTSNCKYAFVVPAFLNSPMLSANETEAIEILEKPASAIQALTGANLDFLQFVKESCSKRRHLRQAIESHDAADLPAQTQQLLEATFESHAGEQIRGMREMLDQNLLRARDSVRRLEELSQSGERLQGMRDQLDQQGFSDNPQLEELLRSGLNEQGEVDQILETARDMVSQVEEAERVFDRTVEQVRAEAFEAVRQGMRDQSAKVAADLKKELEDLDSKVKEEIARFLNVGATVQGSFVLHACAANRIPEYIDMLLETIPSSEVRGIINAFDDNGSTPLMIAAGVSLDGGKDQVDMIAKLLSLGADKDIVNLSGETALGNFRAAKRSSMDFRNTFSLGTRSDNVAIESQIEALLLPSGGATPADDAYVDDPSSDESDQFILMDDNDEDEDDIGEEEDENDEDDIDDDEDGDDIDGEEDVE